jgi:hypothetical protein
MKSIPKEDGTLSRLEMDIMVCGQVFDGIVPLLYAFESPTCVHFVMELLHGTCLIQNYMNLIDPNTWFLHDRVLG